MMGVRGILGTGSVAAIAAAMLAAPASAAVCTWNGGVGTWATGGSWSCGVVPGAGDDVFIDGGNLLNSVVTLGGGRDAGTLAISSGDQLSLVSGVLNIHNGAVANNGTITIGANSRLRSTGNPLLFSGAGTIVLNDSGGFSYLGDVGAIYTFGSGQTVRGRGSVGLNVGVFVNDGLISADVSGATITIDANGGSSGIFGGVGTVNPGGLSAGMLNNATMEAASGGTLSFVSGRYEQGASGVIRALAGSTVALGNDVRIIGGTLTSVGTGLISGTGGGARYLDGVTLSTGSQYLQVSGITQLSGTFTNNGTVTLGTNSYLRTDGGAVSIAGTGTIVLDNSGGFSYIGDSGGIFTFGSGQTVRGRGSIGLNAGIFINNGLISADVNGATITIDANGGSGGVAGGVGSGTAGLLNNTIMEAVSGGTVSFASGRYEQASGGVIRALEGSTVALGNDARIVGGTLTSVGTGVISGTSGTRYLDGVTLSTGSQYTQASGVTQLSGTFTNNGTVTLGTNSVLRSDGGTVTIAGTGTIVLDNSGGFAYIGDSGGIFTFGSGQTVRGRGNVGLNAGIFINNGLISADVDGATLTIDVASGSGGVGGGGGVGTGNTAGFLNNATLEARNGGTLVIEAGRYENAGLMLAQSGSTLRLESDARIVGGTLTSVGTGVISGTSGTRYLDGVTLSTGSQYTQASGVTQLSGTFTNNGTVTLGTNSYLRTDGGAVSIAGTGTIVLDNSGSFAYIGDSGGIFTFGSGQTVRGRGSIGVNGGIFINNGLISADVDGATLRIDVASGSGGVGGGGGVGTGNTAGFLNNATLEARNGGTLVIEAGRYENAGLMLAQSGSTLRLESDARIVGGTLTSVGTGVISGTGGTRYLDGVTLSTGSQYNQTSGVTQLSGSFTNNGTVTLGTNSYLRMTGSPITIDGTGTIVLDNTSGFSYIGDTGGLFTFGSGQTVRGRGSIGLNAGIFINNGLISADVSGATIAIDVAGGSGGLGGAGVGTSGAGLYNTGTIEARNGGTLSIAGGLYENSATGGLSVDGGTLTFGSDANLFNLKAGGLLDKGRYSATGGTMTLRANGIGSIVTIGTAAVGTDTIVTLNGPGSVINVLLGATTTAIDSSLTTVAQSGRLEVLGGRNLTIVAGGGNFSNAGVVELGGGTFNATSFTNSGETFGFGTIGVGIANSGTVRAGGGTLSTQAITGTSGSVIVDAGATLALGGTSTAGILFNGGQLALGTSTITVTTDYNSTAFGAGNGFNGRANVSGTGLILAASATQDLSGPDFAGGVLDLGNIRVGGATSTDLTVTNNGALTTLRGAVQNGAAPGVTLGSPDFVIGPGGGSAVVSVNFAGAVAGSLDGQTLNVVNNFDNVADATIILAGKAWNPAVAALSPDPINLGNVRIGDTPSGIVTIANVAPGGGFSEGLRVTGTTPSGGASISGVPTGVIAAGSSADATVGISTATAGAQAGSVSFAFVTDGTGTSGLPSAPIAGGSVAVTANVFALANPVLLADLAFGNVQEGSVQTRTISVSNALLGGVPAGFQEGLNAAFGAVSAGFSGSGAITNLGAGLSDNVTLVVTLDTTTAGTRTGTVQVLLASNGAGTSGLGLLNLGDVVFDASATVEGTVYRLAQAEVAPLVVALGNRRVGDAAPAPVALTITNTAIDDGFSERLDASVGATTGRATGAGTISLLDAQASSNAITVGIDTSAAGANGTVQILLASNGEGTSGFGVTPLAPQTVVLEGGVYRLAAADVAPTDTVIVARVGDSAGTTITIRNTAVNDGYSEGLGVTGTATGGGVSFGPSDGLVAAGDQRLVTATVDTATAGVKTGALALAFTSDGTGTSGLAAVGIGSANVSVDAQVYAVAVANVAPTVVDFGVVRVGDTVAAQTITIQNAAAGALADTLVTGAGPAPAGFITGAGPGPLAAGESGTIAVSLDTGTAGSFGGDLALGFVSRNPVLVDLALGTVDVALSGTVNNLADPVFTRFGSALAYDGTLGGYVFDLGSVTQGGALTLAGFGLGNLVLGPADDLSGLVTDPLGGAFSLGGAFDIGLLGAGQVSGPFNIFFDRSATGSFMGELSFAGLGTNASDPVGLGTSARLFLKAQVTPSGPGGVIPEPGTWAMMIVGFGAIGAGLRRRREAVTA